MQHFRPTWLAGASVLAAALTGCGHRAAPPAPGPPTVGYVVVEPQSVELTTELPGRTDAYLSSDVRPQVNGIIKARPFTEGTNVKAGQLLYQIDPAPYQAAYDQARATVANAQAVLTTNRLKAERYADLVKINAVSRQDYNDAEAAYQQAAATVQQDQAASESARINLGYTRVTAPISGRVGRSAATPGALVTAGQTTALSTIQSLDPIYVDVTQSSDELLRLKQEMAQGQIAGAGPASTRVHLLLSDGSAYPLEGQLRFSEALVDQTTGSVTLRALFPNPRAELLPGMYVRAVVVEGVDPNAIMAPQQGVSRNERGQPTAMVIDAQNKAQLRVLTTDRAIGDRWLVTSGLNPGDHLIVEGLLSVQQPGMAVKPAPASQPAQPGTGSRRPPAVMAGGANSLHTPTSSAQ